MANTPPIYDINSALNAACDLAAMVRQTVEGLLGATPEASGKSLGADIVPDGVLSRTASSARYAHEQIGKATQLLHSLQEATGQIDNMPDVAIARSGR